MAWIVKKFRMIAVTGQRPENREYIILKGCERGKPCDGPFVLSSVRKLRSEPLRNAILEGRISILLIFFPQETNIIPVLRCLYPEGLEIQK
jgi:hypothetical protein